MLCFAGATYTPARWHDCIAAQDEEQGHDPWAQIMGVWAGLQPRQRRIDVSTRSIVLPVIDFTLLAR